MAFKAGAIYGEAVLDTTKWESGIKRMGKSALGVAKVAGAAFVGAMTVSIAKANEFQKAMSNVSTVIDTSKVSTQDMTKSLLTMDPALGKTTDLTNALYQSFSAGAADATEAMQTTVDAAKFGKAGLTDTATAVDLLTTASNAYGKDIVSTTDASDIFFTTIKQGKITGEQLAGTIGKSIPLFASMNIPLEELGAGMAAMTKQGVNASESTTQLNGIVNAFLKPSADMAAALEAQGIASGSALLESEGLSGALAFLETASGGSKDELSKLLPSIEAVRGTLALTGTGGEEFNKILGEMENATGATDIAFDKQEKTFETLKNQMDKVAVVSGNIGKHFVDEIAGGATEAAGAMLTFITSSSGMEVVANIVAGTASVFDFLKETITPIVDTVLPPLIDLFLRTGEELGDLKRDGEPLIGVFDIFAGALQFSASAIKIFITLAEAQVVTLVNLFSIVKETGGVFGSFFKALTGKGEWSDFKDQLVDVKDAVFELGTEFAGSYVDLFTTIGSEVKSFIPTVKDTAIEMGFAITTTFSDVKDKVVSNWDEMLTGQEDVLEEMTANNEEAAAAQGETSDVILEENLSLIAKLKGAWTAHFTEAKFSWKELASVAMGAISSSLASISEISDQHFTNEKAKRDNDYNESLTALEENLESGAITQAEFDEQKAILDEEAKAAENAAAEKQFAAQKKLKIANVWMDAASSIASWWSTAGSLGPIAGPIFAGTMTAASLGMAGKQTSLISKQEFVPAKQFGGMAGGMTRINEAGGEIVTLPDGSQVIPNDISRQIADNSAGAGGVVVNFNGAIIDSKMDLNQVAEAVSRKISQRLRVS